jgi:hypothetical protein
MADRRNYTVTMRTGKDGTQYLRIRETPAHGHPARRWVSSLVENLNLLKAGLGKALRFVSRRA